ncbi:feruloyl esterase B [Penicillium odoratum]|uniref:feruloyl esterase B n=1 Tax=Penicillium odoratum TaxID=1167516 RepID=UPI002546C87B|nr:feruloyl esterase B [Penicillium odoratum]KAJ5765729.1 feruloyl esterase B [Penicillium odoratum]
MNVSTSDRSHLRTEVWLPRNYTGRFLSTGNNGMSGCVKQDDLSFATKFGFASVGTNAGHDGDTAEYFLGNPEVLADYAYRSVHVGSVVGKKVTELFYSQGYNTSYYLGCSTGGRQGYQSVQRYPDDFDGVVAGSAAFNFVNLISWGGYLYNVTGTTEDADFISIDKWSTIHEEIMRQCDTIDGAKDGIIEDPDLCSPILETLICNETTSANSSSCITGRQANIANLALSDFYGPEGKLYYPRLQPGAEADSAAIYFSGSPFSTLMTWYRYVVYNDSTWNASSWTPESAKLALDQNPFNVESFDANISAFRNRGGKLLAYHGMQDPIISSTNSKLYYRRVADALNQPPAELDNFFRFFPISGMGHCGSGAGASYIGQSWDTYSDEAPENNMLATIVNWVEKGIAPEYVRGAKLDASGSVEYMRKHCRYPQRNIFTGPGNYTSEDAWRCI